MPKSKKAILPPDLVEVWLVGGRKDSPFADVYRHELDAQAAIMKYIFEDEDDWFFGRLNEEQKYILKTLRTNNAPFQTILNYYNSVAAHDNQWHLTQADVH